MIAEMSNLFSSTMLNYFLETNRLPLLRSMPGDRSGRRSTLWLPFSAGGRSGKR
jgi:hypothetical protein